MVEIFGRTKRNAVVDGEQIIVFLIPAFTRGNARRRARVNARAKGFQNYSVTSVEEFESGGIPGQSLYEVTVTVQR